MNTSFLSNQNTDEAIKLLRASSCAYSKAKKAENIITLVLLFLAFSYPIFYILSKNEQTKLLLFQVSFFLSVFIQIFSPVFKGNTAKGALLKEEFDTTLFGLPWKTTLKKIDPFEVSRLSVEYKGKAIKDWYPVNFSDSIPSETLIAVCQRCNTAYDIELRKKYSSILFSFLIVYTIGFALVVVLNNMGGNAVFFICFSIISFYAHFITIIRGHKTVIEKRTQINSKLDTFIFGNTTPTLQELRDIQDEIFLTRQENAKVPDFYFRICSNEMNRSFKEFVKKVNEQFR